MSFSTSFKELPMKVRTTIRSETFATDVTSLVTRASIKVRIAFATAVLTVNGGNIGLCKEISIRWS